MANPFETQTGDFLVLRNDQGHLSLWPGFAEVPAGWQIVLGPDTRHACVNYVEQNS
jgi:MbtH protein